MDIEILLGGLVGLSFIAVLIFLLTGRDAHGKGTADLSTGQRRWADKETSKTDYRP